MSSVFHLEPYPLTKRILYSGFALAALMFAGVLLFVPIRGWFLSRTAEPMELAAVITSFGAALLMVWLAWTCRLGALPFSFFVDSVARESGYRWWIFKTQRTDLSEVKELRGDVSYVVTGPGTGSWRWSIIAEASDSDSHMILHSPALTYSDVTEAKSACQELLKELGGFLDLSTRSKLEAEESGEQDVPPKSDRAGG